MGVEAVWYSHKPATLFYESIKLEREFILQSIKSPNDTENELNEGRQLGRDLDPEMPHRYKNIKLSPTWYASASGKRTRTKESDIKRKHRKSHGKISFQELSQRIASGWKTLDQTDNETMMYCAKIAKIQLQSYKEKVKQYKASIAAREQLHDSLERMNSSFTSMGSSSSCLNSPGAGSVSQRSNSSVSMRQQLSSSMSQSPGAPSASMSGSSSIKASSKFIPTKLNKLTGNQTYEEHLCAKRSMASLSKTKRTSTNEKFSFFPLPPSLQEREDAFIENCQKKAKMLSNLGQSPQRPLMGVGNDRTDMMEINDVIFDSTMSDLNPRTSFLMENDPTNGSRKRSSSCLSDGQISPLQCLGDSLMSMEYKFTPEDAEFLLKALF